MFTIMKENYIYEFEIKLLELNLDKYESSNDKIMAINQAYNIELENTTITEDQYKYYRDKDITTVMLPKLEVRKSYNYLIYILSEIGLKKTLLFLG